MACSSVRSTHARTQNSRVCRVRFQVLRSDPLLGDFAVGACEAVDGLNFWVLTRAAHSAHRPPGIRCRAPLTRLHCARAVQVLTMFAGLLLHVPAAVLAYHLLYRYSVLMQAQDAVELEKAHARTSWVKVGNKRVLI